MIRIVSLAVAVMVPVTGLDLHYFLSQREKIIDVATSF